MTKDDQGKTIYYKSVIPPGSNLSSQTMFNKKHLMHTILSGPPKGTAQSYTVLCGISHLVQGPCDLHIPTKSQ